MRIKQEMKRELSFRERVRLLFGYYAVIACILAILLTVNTATISQKANTTTQQVVSRMVSSSVRVDIITHDGRIGHGSGVYIGDGLIVTAAHVLEDANSITVVTPDGSWAASDWYYTGFSDCGVIRISPHPPLPAADLATVKPLVGSTVYICGTPACRGLLQSLTRGIISHTNRRVPLWVPDCVMYQVDAAAYPGSSGAPVFNEYGEVIGLVRGGPTCHGTLCSSLVLVVPVDQVRIMLEMYEAERQLDVSARTLGE